MRYQIVFLTNRNTFTQQQKKENTNRNYTKKNHRIDVLKIDQIKLNRKGLVIGAFGRQQP